MATIDTALAAQNAALAAESLGLGVVFIGGMRNKAQIVADMLGLPPFAWITFGMVVGHPSTTTTSTTTSRLRPRPSQDVVLHHDGYQHERAARIEAYERPFKTFREMQGMREKRFADAVDVATNDVSAMDGREHLRAMVEARGFMLR